MKRNFYLTITAMRKAQVEPTEAELIPFVEKVFPVSDVQSHIADKLHGKIVKSGGNWLVALLNFYESLDTDHQVMFDIWANQEIDKQDNQTVQYDPTDIAHILYTINQNNERATEK